MKTVTLCSHFPLNQFISRQVSNPVTTTLQFLPTDRRLSLLTPALNEVWLENGKYPMLSLFFELAGRAAMCQKRTFQKPAVFNSCVLSNRILMFFNNPSPARTIAP